MVYVDRNGAVYNQRPIWTPSGFYYLIVSFINFLVLFVRSLIDPTLTKYGRNMESTNYRTGGGGGGGGGSDRFDRPPKPPQRRRMGGFGPSTSGPGCAPMAGG